MWEKELKNEHYQPLNKNLHPSSGGAQLPSRRKKNALMRSFRFALASLICIAILIGSIIGGLYFLLQGETSKRSAVVARIEAGLQDVVGDDFKVNLQNVNLEFSTDASVVFKTNNAQITRNSDGEVLSAIGVIETKLNLFEALNGSAVIENVRIENLEVNADILGRGAGVFLPTHLDIPFNIIGETLSKFQQNLDEGKFKRFEIVNSTINGNVLGRKQKDPIALNFLSVTPDGSGRFKLSADLKTEFSNIKISSSYELQEDKTSSYNFLASGIHLREWLSDPDIQEGVIGSNAIINVAGNIPFNENTIALEPTMNIQSDESILRFGRAAKTDVGNLNLNLRLILAENQIELDPSNIQLGRLKASWIGGIKPYNAQRGYGGSLRYDLIMEQGVFEPTRQGETTIPAGFKIAGLYNVDDKDLLIDRILLTTQNGSVQGKGQMLFDGETPAIKAQANTDGISVVAIKQFWPFFMAGGARDWTHKHIIDGWVDKGTLKADIPPGIIFRVKDGAKIKPEEFSLQFGIKDVSFIPFGEMPAIRKGKGQVEISGMKISSSLNSGIASADGSKSVNIKSGSFEMKDYAANSRIGNASITLEGDAKSIAKIADRKPLRVMERMKVSADQFSGNGFADIVTKFPIGEGTNYSKVDWNVLLDLQNASSTKKLAGRQFSDANIVIEATPISAKVTGEAKIDGVKARLDLVEPIGKSGKAKRKREVTTTMSDKARKALGIDLSPVIEGPIKVAIVERSGTQSYKIDFKDAVISMPWVGWSKGKGIPASSEFSLKASGNLFNLNDFKLIGTGFFAAGNLVMSKKGLISAKLSRLKLNDNDNIALNIQRENDTYNIAANGGSYDARGVMNTLLYQASFDQVQGKRSVNLIAKFKEVKGFEKRKIFNVDLKYQSRNGKLTKLDMVGAGANNANYNVQAQRNGNETLFTIKSNNAGNALAFTNIYTRMEGGQINTQLVRRDNGPFLGPVKLKNFVVVNEPRLASLVSNVRRQVPNQRGQRSNIIPLKGDKRIKFELAQAKIEKGTGYLNLKDAIIRNNAIGLSMDGILYNNKDYMNLKGTFMPANSVNLAVSAIPILGRFFANGKDRALIGITYKLSGPRTNPEMLVNPLSIVTPGFFNRVFEFQ